MCRSGRLQAPVRGRFAQVIDDQGGEPRSSAQAISQSPHAARIQNHIVIQKRDPRGGIRANPSFRTSAGLPSMRFLRPSEHDNPDQAQRQ